MDIQNLKDPHIAVISDIHGNYVALERCLDHAASNQANAYLFLGDYVSELAYPERTMRLLYETAQKYPCMFIRGNKEDYWFQFRDRGETGWEYGNSTSGALLYAYRSLTSRDFDFFSQMPASRKLLLEGFPGITACHGSPFRVNEKMLPEDENTLQIMERTQTPLILFGHTHVRTRIAGKDRLAINPGSAGISYRSGGKASISLPPRRSICCFTEGTAAGRRSRSAFPMIRTGLSGSFMNPACIVTRPIGVWLRRTFCGAGSCPMEPCWQG